MTLSLRKLMAGVLVAAVTFAVGAPYIRQWEYDRQLRFVLLATLSLFVQCLYFGMIAILHRRACRRAGRYVASMYETGNPMLPNSRTAELGVAIATGIALFAWFAAISSIPSQSNPKLPAGGLVFVTVVNAWVAAQWLVAPLGCIRGTSQLCEKGIILNRVTYQRWPARDQISWSEHTGRLRLAYGKWNSFSGIVPQESRASVTQLLADQFLLQNPDAEQVAIAPGVRRG